MTRSLHHAQKTPPRLPKTYILLPQLRCFYFASPQPPLTYKVSSRSTMTYQQRPWLHGCHPLLLQNFQTTANHEIAAIIQQTQLLSYSILDPAATRAYNYTLSIRNGNHTSKLLVKHDLRNRAKEGELTARIRAISEQATALSRQETEIAALRERLQQCTCDDSVTDTVLLDVAAVTENPADICGHFQPYTDNNAVDKHPTSPSANCETTGTASCTVTPASPTKFSTTENPEIAAVINQSQLLSYSIMDPATTRDYNYALSLENGYKTCHLLVKQDRRQRALEKALAVKTRIHEHQTGILSQNTLIKAGLEDRLKNCFCSNSK
ncbi:uncharacterized protein LOC108894796 [Lates calcarifer]|uniref:Uncharacterized protein LOC108894796 n=1 Tax=Lates calcarifer TaxID=8187 RepID=A0AAJ8DMH6_LATCA|nr:uncharacterized protein LOC108894796 [Lates calcarifer]